MASIFCVVSFIGMLVYVIQPGTERREFKAEVVSVAITQGYGESGQVALVQLSDGRQVSVLNNDRKSIQAGQEINVLELERRFGLPSKFVMRL